MADQSNPERGGDKRASQSKEERGAQSRNGINQRQETSINGKEGRKSRQTLEKQSDAVDGVAGASWNLVLDELKRDNQDYRSISVSSGKASVSLSGYGNQRAADNYTFDPRNGKITGAQLYKDTDLSARMRGWIWSVHVGSWGGLLMRII